MSTKNNPGAYDCHANAEPDEPMFTLLARDADAPDVVRHWAIARAMAIALGRKPNSDTAMVEEAKTCAADMEAWRRDHRPEAPRSPLQAAQFSLPRDDFLAFATEMIRLYGEVTRLNGRVDELLAANIREFEARRRAENSADNSIAIRAAMARALKEAREILGRADAFLTDPWREDMAAISPAEVSALLVKIDAAVARDAPSTSQGTRAMTADTPASRAARAEAISAAATPGPWEIKGISQTDGSISFGPKNQPVVIGYITNAISFGDFVNSALRGRRDFGAPDTATTQIATAQFVIETCTLLPALAADNRAQAERIDGIETDRHALQLVLDTKIEWIGNLERGLQKESERVAALEAENAELRKDKST